MESEHYKSLLNLAPFGYAHHKIVLDEFKTPVDYVFLDVNTEFEKITGLDSTIILNERVLKVLPDIKKDSFNWISFYGEVALKGGVKELEQYSERLKRTYKIKVFSNEKFYFTTIFTDITKEKIVSTTSLLFSGKPDYQRICDTFSTISNAKYVFLNILEPLSHEFTTVAHTKINASFERIAELLGFDIRRKKWEYNPVRAEKIKYKTITRFSSLKGLTGDVLPIPIVTKVEKLFGTGEALVVKIMNKEEFLGDFTVIMPKGETLINESLVEIFAGQVGLYLSRYKSERILERFFSVNLDLLCIADLEGNFIKINNTWTEVLGYSLSEIKGRKFLDFVHPEDVQSTLRAIHTLKLREKVINFVNRYQTKDGVYRHIEWRSYPQGNLIYAAARDITERIHMENMLRTSEAKFRSLVSQSLEMLYLHDLEGNLSEVNKEAILKSGYSKDELLSMNVFDLHPDASTKDQIISQWKNWPVGQSHILEVAHKRKDGEIFPVEISTGKILINNQEFILALCRDITKRKNAETELKSSETRFRSLFEQTHDAVFILNLEGHHIAANHRAAEMLGYSYEEIQNISFKETSAETESSSRVLKRLIKGEKIPTYERTFKRKDGELIFCELNVELVYDSVGKPMHIQSVARDITKRKKAEEALLKAKELLEQTSRMAWVGGWEKNFKNGGDNWSETTKAIHEVPEDFQPSMENAIGFYKKGESRGKIADAVGKLKETGQPYDLELQIVTAKGKEKWIRTIGNAEFSDGKCVRLYGAFQDIDERKKNELALRESKEKLKELNVTKDKFFSIIAHDLKSVFNGILGFTELLTGKAAQNDVEKLLTYSNLLSDVAKSGYALLENLLHWARVQTGRIEFIPSHVSLNKPVYNILEVYKLNIKEKDIKVNVSISESQQVYTDASMLDTILRNLISNAIKFTHKGGSVKINASEVNGEVTVSVSDTGVGIREDIIPKLFRIDTNVITKGTNNERGTGLGLILCKEFVEKHGGKIWLESEWGAGSTFSFTLPGKKKLE